MNKLTAIIVAVVVCAAGLVHAQNRIASGSTYHTIEPRNIMPYSLWTSCVFWATCDTNPSNFPGWTVESFAVNPPFIKRDMLQSTASLRPTFASKVLTFDGIDDFASNAAPFSVLNGVEEFSASAWVYCTETNAEKCILNCASTLPVSFSDGFQLRVFTNNNIKIVAVADTAGLGSGFYWTHWTTDSYRVPINTWTHIAATVNLVNSNVVIYANGVSQAATKTTVVAGPMTMTIVRPLELGAVIFNAGRAGYFVGKMDDVSVFRRGLSALEVTNLYNATKSPTPARP